MQTLHSSEVLAYTAQETAGNMSIGKTKIIGFSPAKIKKEAEEYLVSVQTEKLIKYAKEEIVKLGDKIQTYNSQNHMDRTGNLLNSLCWGVAYKGELKGSGLYRDETTHSKGLNGASVSFLHEFFKNDQEEVNGREMAQKYIQSFKGRANGWTLFIAILAPYWGYWESGFTMKFGFEEDEDGNMRTTQRRFMQFQVMTHIFDDVRMALKPAETRFSVFVPKYSYQNRKYKNRKGYKKIGILR